MPELKPSELLIRKVLETYIAHYRRNLSEEIKKGLRAKKMREQIAKVVK